MTKKAKSERPVGSAPTTVAQQAARAAMFTGAVAGAGHQAAMAQEQASTGPVDEIIVTGSRIRRVDGEVATPVQVITAEQVAQTGATTLGEFISKLPAIGGAATNPAVNNGGGDGATNIELRGLDVKRTLILLNGRRYGAIGNLSAAVDVNSIPVNMIERVEVLKQGAGAIYGSDAIAGVVNFITKTKADGADVSIDYGESSEHDGTRKGVSLSWGSTDDTGSILMGMNYNKQEAISAGDRDFSKNATYFYGSIFVGGSSRTPTGRYFFDTPSAAALGLDVLFDCGATGNDGATRIGGTAGDSLDDFRCYIPSGPGNDSYNFQPQNLILTPTERASVFFLGSHKISDKAEAYVEFIYNRTQSGFKIAPLPFDPRGDNVVISKDNLYNPFGIDFGGTGVDGDGELLNPNATFRLEAVGNRRNEVETWQGQIVGGLRGDLFNTSWKWDTSLLYSRMDQDTVTSGYLFKSAIVNALGPSFLDGGEGGTPTCGTPSAPIAGCVPLNIFNLAAADVASLRGISPDYNQSYTYALTTFNLNLNGEVFDLPAGAVSLAVGYEYRDQKGIFDTDYLSQSGPPLFKDCLLSSDACSGDQRGSYDVNEVYAEAFVPLLKDVPGVKSLNLTAGLRYSDYSSFGDTTNFSLKVDWRPIDDLMVRASYAEVFRAPNITEIYQAPTGDAPTFTDPCAGLTQAQLDDPTKFYALACVGVAPDTNFQQPNSQIDGLLLGAAAAGVPLNPEEGDQFTVGVVWEPSFLDGFSMNVDYWDVSLDQLITQLDPNVSAQICVDTGASAFCDLHTRFGDGTTQQFLEPTTNLGKLDVSGVDLGVKYDLLGTGIGDFRFGLEATYTDTYDNTITATNTTLGVSTTIINKVAGFYDRQYGNIADWRATALVGWSLGDFESQVSARYIDSVRLSDPDAQPGVQPDLIVASQIYWDMSIGYKLASTGTKLQLGINNMFDNQPPFLYQNNVTNANTDVETYDTIGRFFFGSISQKF